MIEDDTEQKIERKAKRRAVISGALTSMFIVFLLIIIPFFSLLHDKPIITAFEGALCFLLFFSPLGALAGSIGGKMPDVTLGAGISAMIFGFVGFVISLMDVQISSMTFLFIPLFCCASAITGSLCGGVGAVFARTCREFKGERFWPQFSVAELMILVFLVAILMSCLVTLRQILGKSS
jgi:hypothetical protein